MFSADALGGKLASHSKRTVSGLSVSAFNTTEAFLRFQFQRETGGGLFPIAGDVVIDCTLDPEDNVMEILEDNNESSFFFRAYCRRRMSRSDPDRSGGIARPSGQGWEVSAWLLCGPSYVPARVPQNVSMAMTTSTVPTSALTTCGHTVSALQ
jgi:hypothetical protein